MAQYILAHDIGTSGDKATLYTTEGCYVDSVVSPYKTYYSNGCWAEQDPDDWWKAVCESTAKLMEGKNRRMSWRFPAAVLCWDACFWTKRTDLLCVPSSGPM